MPITYEEIRIRGKDTLVPAARIGRTMTIVTGRWIRHARLKDEELLEGEAVADPGTFVSLLKGTGLPADLFSFAERPPQITPRYPYHVEWDNWAVIPITTFQGWWEKRLPQETRKNVRRAARDGVIVKSVPFDDELVSGIERLYNETAVRQGRRFWHFGKDFASVKRITGDYRQRSEFIGAFLNRELIGFVKIVYTDRIGTLVQILAMNAQRDKRPMNALLAHTVGVCERRKVSLLVYGKYTYANNTESSLTEFKRRNGFEEMRFPRYYVPLNTWGRLAIRLGLHHPVGAVIPSWALGSMRDWRSRFYLGWPRPRRRAGQEQCSD